jgi:hypothetical protein
VSKFTFTQPNFIFKVTNEVAVQAGGATKFLKVCHEAPSTMTNGIEAVVDDGGFLRNNKDKGKVIVFTAPAVTNGNGAGR